MNFQINGQEAIRRFISDIFQQRYPQNSPDVLMDVFDEVVDLFNGDFPHYRACDTHFHDFAHTCDATVAALRIADGFCQSGHAPGIDSRSFEMLTVATLLHDSGYIRKESDTSAGTGAKYTTTHVRRSADFAADFLLRHGFAPNEIRSVELAIYCTGINVNLNRLAFTSEQERLIGCILGAGDLLGQMAAPDYPEKLGGLYDEFVEAGIEAYASAVDLMQRTRGFYESYVCRMLVEQWAQVDTYIPRHFGCGNNPYHDAIMHNIERIEAMAIEEAARPVAVDEDEF